MGSNLSLNADQLLGQFFDALHLLPLVIRQRMHPLLDPSVRSSVAGPSELWIPEDDDEQDGDHGQRDHHLAVAGSKTWI